MVERRDVELLIRAKDLSSRPLKDVARSLDQISTSLGRQIEAARRGEVSYQELSDSLRQVQDAGRALVQQQGLLDRFVKLNAESTKLASSVKTAADALQAYRASLDRGGDATKKQEREVAALEKAFNRADVAFAKNAASLQAVQSQIAAAGIDTKALAEAQQQIVASSTQAGQAATALSTAMAGYARNAREAKDAAKAAAAAEASAAEAQRQRAAVISGFNAALQSQATQEAAAQEKKAAAISKVNAALREEAGKQSAAESAQAARAAEAEAAAQEKKAAAISKANAALREER